MVEIDPKADKRQDENYSEQETVARREAALKRMLSTPHKPMKPSKGTGAKRGRPLKPRTTKDSDP
jgi:hypothetical protein